MSMQKKIQLFRTLFSVLLELNTLLDDECNGNAFHLTNTRNATNMPILSGSSSNGVLLTNAFAYAFLFLVMATVVL